MKRVSRRPKRGHNYAGLNRSISDGQMAISFAKKQTFNFPNLKKGSQMDRRMDRNLDTLELLKGQPKLYQNKHKSSEQKMQEKQLSIQQLKDERDELTKMLASMSDESRLKQLRTDVSSLRLEK